VLNFSGKKEEWPTWNEILSQGQVIWFERCFLGPGTDTENQDPVDERTKEGKKKIEIVDFFYEMAFTKLILSIDAASSAGKFAFGIVKSCKSKEYVDGDAALAWEKLSKKYDLISAPSLVKTERIIR
jgi:hypothetical protein